MVAGAAVAAVGAVDFVVVDAAAVVVACVCVCVCPGYEPPAVSVTYEAVAVAVSL